LQEATIPKSALRWDDLRLLLEVARQGSLHAAARQLGLDHTTVGRRIGTLEAGLGLKLFDRKSGGLQLRSEAGDLVRHAESMEWHACSFADLAQRGSGRGLRTVRIATMEGIATGYLARRIALLDPTGDSLRIELVSIPHPADLGRKEADLFVSFFNPRVAGLQSQKIGEFAAFLYGSHPYAVRFGLPQDKTELRSHRYVGYVEDLLAIEAVRWLEEMVEAPRIVFRSTSVFAQREAAVAGMGLVVLPTFVGGDEPRLERLLSDQDRIMREVWLSVRAEQAYTPSVRAVIRFLTKRFAEDDAFLRGDEPNLASRSDVPLG